jgi:hypothetical protein
MRLSRHLARLALAALIFLTFTTLLLLSSGLWQTASANGTGSGVVVNGTPSPAAYLPLILRDHNPAYTPTDSPPPTPPGGWVPEG